MPLSIDPTDVSLVLAALEKMWGEIKGTVPEADHQRERTRIAYLVAKCAPLALDEEDLKRNVLLQYRESQIS